MLPALRYSSPRVPPLLCHVRRLWIDGTDIPVKPLGKDPITGADRLLMQSPTHAQEITGMLEKQKEPNLELSWDIRKHCTRCSVLCDRTLITTFDGSACLSESENYNSDFACFMYVCSECHNWGLPVTLSLEMGQKLVEKARQLADDPKTLDEAEITARSVVSSWPSDSAAIFTLANIHARKADAGVSVMKNAELSRDWFERGLKTCRDGSHPYLQPLMEQRLSFLASEFGVSLSV